MNSFGTVFRVSIFGESHGAVVGVVIDGCPPGIEIKPSDFAEDLERRRGGGRKGVTPRKEDDVPIVVSGVFNDRSTGAPITILFENKNTRSGDYEKQKEIPRPGHADYAARQKFAGYADYRGGGHFSGRLTVGIVAAGVVAKLVLKSIDATIDITTSIKEIGGEAGEEAGLNKAITAKDSVGGIVECIVRNLPAGVGEPFFDSVESLLSHVMFAIPAVKGIEFGSGFAAARMYGSEHNDPIINAEGRTASNHAGGINGGISNGNNIVFRVAVKPTSSTPKAQRSWNVATEMVEEFSVKGRHDLCIALRVPPVMEAATAMVMVDLILRSGVMKTYKRRDE